MDDILIELAKNPELLGFIGFLLITGLFYTGLILRFAGNVMDKAQADLAHDNKLQENMLKLVANSIQELQNVVNNNTRVIDDNNKIKMQLIDDVTTLGQQVTTLSTATEGIQTQINAIYNHSKTTSDKVSYLEKNLQRAVDNVIERTGGLLSNKLGVMAFDKQGNMIVINQAAADMLGIKMMEAVGKNYKDWVGILRYDRKLFDPEDYPVGRVIKTGKPWRNTIMGVPHDEQYTWVLANAEPVKVNGVIEWIILTIIDVSPAVYVGEADNGESKNTNPDSTGSGG